MLSSISWQQYFAAVAIISLSYYLYVILRYYQRELSNRFAFKKAVQPSRQSSMLAPIEIMGSARQDQNAVSFIDEKMLQFAETNSTETLDEEITGQPPSGSSTLSPQQELFREVDNLIQAFSDVNSKPEFISLLNILLNTYDQYPSDINRSQVNDHILEVAESRLPFDLAPYDLIPNQYD